MTSPNEMIDTWLRDAHATEAQAATMLRGTASRNEDYADFSRLLREQADISDGHAKALDQCLEARGSGTSFVKDAAGQITALGQSVSGMVVGDELMKAALATTTFARMQTASARVITAAAGSAGDAETERVCQAMANANERFAIELEELLPKLTVDYLAREAGDEPSRSGSGEISGSGTNAAQTFV